MGFRPREIIPSPCVVCLRPYWPYRSDRVYCSPACKQAAYRTAKRSREKLAGDQAGDVGGMDREEAEGDGDQAEG